MVRRALIYHLILAVAVGPLLCCCSAGKASAAPATTGAPAPVRAPAARTAHACCSHKEAPAKPGAGQKPAPAKPQRPAGKCPCKEEAGKPQIAQEDLAQADLATFLRALALDTPTPFVFPVAGKSGPGANGLDAGRYLDCSPSPTDELLFAHHNLRC